MTLWGNLKRISSSYSIPFLVVGIVFYFTGSMQGSVEAFRWSNKVWHFTDFTVAHSHIAMYGIVSFMLWGFIYTLAPRLAKKQPSQLAIGIHFWFALVGMLVYTIPLMIGATLKGLSWEHGDPFINSVVLMSDYWLWRAIGGLAMLVSHFVFAFNLFTMLSKDTSNNLETIEMLTNKPVEANV